MLHLSTFIGEGDDRIKALARRKSSDKIGGDNSPKPRYRFDRFESTLRFLISIFHELADVAVSDPVMDILLELWPIVIIANRGDGCSDSRMSGCTTSVESFEDFDM